MLHAYMTIYASMWMCECVCVSMHSTSVSIMHSMDIRNKLGGSVMKCFEENLNLHLQSII